MEDPTKHLSGINWTRLLGDGVFDDGILFKLLDLLNVLRNFGSKSFFQALEEELLYELAIELPETNLSLARGVCAEAVISC